MESTSDPDIDGSNNLAIEASGEAEYNHSYAMETIT